MQLKIKAEELRKSSCNKGCVCNRPSDYTI